VIGRDVLPSLGARIAALRPGVRTAIVTDRNVARSRSTNPSPLFQDDAVSPALVSQADSCKSPRKASQNLLMWVVGTNCC
jgi:3-dehydroquinate synthase